MIFTIEGRLPGLNEYTDACRSNKFAAAKMKKELEEMIMWQIPALAKFENKVWLFFFWVEQDRRRDKDNIAFAKKFILDALVKKGVLANDGWTNISGFTDGFKVDPKRPRVSVEIKEVADG